MNNNNDSRGVVSSESVDDFVLAQDSINVLGEIGREIISSLDIQTITEIVYNNLSRLMDCSIMVVGVYNEKKSGLDLWGVHNNSGVLQMGFEDMQDKYRWSVHCFNSRKEILVNNFNQESKFHFSNLLFEDDNCKRKSFIYLPLLKMDKTAMGVITVQSFKENTYHRHHQYVLQNLANYISIALDNAIKYKKIEVQKEEIQNINECLRHVQESLEEQVQERTKELLKKKNELERLSIVAKKTDNAIMIMDAEGNIQWINEYFAWLYNYSYVDFIKVRGKNIRSTSFNPNIDKVLEECITTKKTVYYEALNISSDGSKIWTQTTLSPVLDNHGNIINLVTIDSDITKRKQMEDRLIKQSADIINSINYARNIQNALLPPIEKFEKAFNECFIFYKPKAVVSGDFYWISQNNEQTIIAVADCTGHGVPGAFMSMLGISSLNDIIKSNQYRSAGHILGKLRKKIKASLHQTSEESTTLDGMDIALCIIDKKQNKLQFSGAFIPLFLLRDSEFIEFKSDRMPIGVHVNDDKYFDDYDIELKPGDKFYMSSDGYKDQFGGKYSSKFLAGNFRKLLENIHTKPFNEQKEILNSTLHNWMGSENHQVDDILVLGFNVF